MWERGAARVRVLAVFAEQCERARALGAATVMSPVDRRRGDVGDAAASLREVGDIAGQHGVKLAVEFNSLAEQLNTLKRMREVMARAAHPACGLLLDITSDAVAPTRARSRTWRPRRSPTCSTATCREAGWSRRRRWTGSLPGRARCRSRISSACSRRRATPAT